MKKEFETEMKVVCAWCGADLGTNDGLGQTGTSHGICKACAKKLEPKAPALESHDNVFARHVFT